MVLDNLTHIGRIGLLLFVLGAVFFLVGFSVPYWVTSGRSRVGLWDFCASNLDGSYTYCTGTVSSNFKFFDKDGPPNWYRGTQALACLALIALVIDFVVRLLFICGKPKKFLLISVVFDCVAAALAFMAAVVFGSEAEKYINISFHFGFAFDIIGGIFFAGAAVAFLVEYCRHR